MSTAMDSEATLLNLPKTIRTWKRGGTRAPHKPLLLLLTLGRIQRGEERLASFLDIEGPLASLLRTFGPPRQSFHPEYPFWRLQNDGVWELEADGPLTPRKSNTDPSVAVLRDREARAGFPASQYEILRKKPQVLTNLARALLGEHFPPSIHEDILSAVGLTLEAAEKKPGRRSPEFRQEVLLAYCYSCAICGLDPTLAGASCGLEAAHLRWHSYGGPSSVDNGICLCSLHHKALDIGMLGLDEEYRIVRSKQLTGGHAVEQFLIAYHGKRLREPQDGCPLPAPEYIKWHATQVFKQPAAPI